MGYKFTNESFSFVHQLYNNGHITNKRFIIINNSSTKGGAIYFGGLPLDITHSLTNLKHITIKCDNNYNNWGSTLTTITVGNKVYHFNEYAQFHLSEYIVIRSKRFVQLMYQQVLGEYFGKDGKCHMVNTYEKEEVIYCQKEVIDNMGDISFVIGNAVVKFAFKKLFNCVGNEYNSLFNLDYGFYGDDTFSFGFPFTDMFKMISFDYEKEEIELGVDNEEIMMWQLSEGKEWNNRLYVYIGNSIMCLVCSIYLMVVLKMRK